MLGLFCAEHSPREFDLQKCQLSWVIKVRSFCTLTAGIISLSLWGFYGDRTRKKAQVSMAHYVICLTQARTHPSLSHSPPYGSEQPGAGQIDDIVSTSLPSRNEHTRKDQTSHGLTCALSILRMTLSHIVSFCQKELTLYEGSSTLRTYVGRNPEARVNLLRRLDMQNTDCRVCQIFGFMILSTSPWLHIPLPIGTASCSSVYLCAMASAHVPALRCNSYLGDITARSGIVVEHQLTIPGICQMLRSNSVILTMSIRPALCLFSQNPNSSSRLTSLIPSINLQIQTCPITNSIIL